ncbi:hypothetical protein [Salinibacter ruber]|uniref:hypothetical protein n=1 Tax=Salinibacter ruber TaxID=146919 RepID=UPI002168052C|nr:hypothetical protein [Salinibacter ruber]MCS3783602.1 hypothetical protein [Salinibacter ruber]
MDKSEEERIFTGPFPWKRAGFIVVHSGMVTRHLAPEMPTSDSGDPLIGRPEKAEREFFGGFHEMKEWFDQHSEDISHADMKLRRDEILDQLATEWEQLQRLGQQAEDEYLDFKEQVMNCLGGVGKQNSGASPYDPDSQSVYGEVELSLYPKWAHLWKESHLMLSHLLDEAINNFNLLAGKYKLLRERRRTSTLGGLEELPEAGDSGREYDPEPQVHQYEFSSQSKEIFQAIVDIVQNNQRLLEANNKSDILRLVHKKIENPNEVDSNKINTRIWKDMKKRNTMDEIYPDSAQELIELARKHPSTNSPDE